MPPARQRLAVLTALAAGVGHAAAFSTDDVSDLSTGAWIGIGVAVLLVLVLFITCCCCCCRRRRQPKSDNHYTAAPHQDAPAPMSNPADYYTVDMYPPRAATPGKSNGGPTTQQTYQSTGGQSWTSAGSAPSGGMWDDPTIVAARIPFEHVQLGELLSRGGFGEVYRGMYRSEKVAIKTLLPATRKDLKSIEAFLGEIKLMASLEHECIVRFIGVAWESLSQLYAVSEFMDGGDLRSLLVEFQAANHAQGFDADKARMAKQAAHGLTYLHSLEPIMLHRDLKSRNILLTAQLDARITDFGTTRENSDKTMTAGVGTSLWMAPEVIMGERYGDKADVFSLGVVLAELDSHELPYAHATQTDTGRPLPETAVLQLVVLGRLRVAVSGRSSPEVNQLIDACVDLEPANRPTAAEVLYRLHTIAKTL